jgi:hypothetical protein
LIILFDSNYREIGQVDIDVDIEVGTASDSSNDFVMSTATIQSLDPYGWYIDGTELGGTFEYSQCSTEHDYSTLMGWSWRGVMALSIISPPANSDYKVVSGEANTIIRSMLANVLGGFFNVSTRDSGLTLNNYQFPLYINTLDGIEGMLEKNGYRLQIVTKKASLGEPVKVYVEAVPSEQVQGAFNKDNRIPMTFTNNNMGINHLICAGEGQLQERMKVDLYLDENGNVSQTQHFFGFEERTQFYGYSGAESEQDLIDNGTERLLELASTKSLDMKAPQDLVLNIGDTVRGVFPDGTEIISPIVNKIFKVTNGLVTVEYKIKGES